MAGELIATESFGRMWVTCGTERDNDSGNRASATVLPSVLAVGEIQTERLGGRRSSPVEQRRPANCARRTATPPGTRVANVIVHRCCELLIGMPNSVAL